MFYKKISLLLLLLPCLSNAMDEQIPPTEKTIGFKRTILEERKRKNYEFYKPTHPDEISLKNNILFSYYSQARTTPNGEKSLNRFTKTDLSNNTEIMFAPVEKFNGKNIYITLLSQQQDKYIIGHPNIITIYTEAEIDSAVTLIPQLTITLNTTETANVPIKLFSQENNDWFIPCTNGSIFKIDAKTVKDQAINPWHTCSDKVHATAWDKRNNKIILGLTGKIRLIDATTLEATDIVIPELSDFKINLLDSNNGYIICAARYSSKAKTQKINDTIWKIAPTAKTITKQTVALECFSHSMIQIILKNDG